METKRMLWLQMPKFAWLQWMSKQVENMKQVQFVQFILNTSSLFRSNKLTNCVVWLNMNELFCLILVENIVLCERIL